MGPAGDRRPEDPGVLCQTQKAGLEAAGVAIWIYRVLGVCWTEGVQGLP